MEFMLGQYQFLILPQFVLLNKWNLFNSAYAPHWQYMVVPVNKYSLFSTSTTENIVNSFSSDVWRLTKHLFAMANAEYWPMSTTIPVPIFNFTIWCKRKRAIWFTNSVIIKNICADHISQLNLYTKQNNLTWNCRWLYQIVNKTNKI